MPKSKNPPPRRSRHPTLRGWTRGPRHRSLPATRRRIEGRGGRKGCSEAVGRLGPAPYTSSTLPSRLPVLPRLSRLFGASMPGVQARLKEEHRRRYLDLDPKIWYQVVPIFPGVTQRMVNMAGERLARLATPRGFVTLRAEHLEFRPAESEAKSQSA